MEQVENNDNSFTSWLLSKHNWVEKTGGVVVLAIELLDLFTKIFVGLPELVLTKLLNLIFLVFIYTQLKVEFTKQYNVKGDDPEVARILRLWRYSNSHKREKISELVFTSNTLISQLKNINRFILITAGLYLLFLAQFIVNKILKSETDNYHVFHFLFDFFSYAGAFYLLRCFYIMYLTTVEKNGVEVLNKKTNVYIFIGLLLMILDVCITFSVPEPTGIFVSEFLCGVVNAVVFILLIARFENKILDIPPFILCILYLYAILQTCLPFVTNTNLGFNEEFAVGFSNIVLKLCLFGKVTLAAVLLYVLNSKRIFYYFMTLRKLHEEEEKHWEEFSDLIEPFSIKPEFFHLTYSRDNDFKIDDPIYTARLNLFSDVEGKGTTPEKAKDNLIKKIRSTEKL
jgi:hypothetical protein